MMADVVRRQDVAKSDITALRPRQNIRPRAGQLAGDSGSRLAWKVMALGTNLPGNTGFNGATPV